MAGVAVLRRFQSSLNSWKLKLLALYIIVPIIFLFSLLDSNIRNKQNNNKIALPSEIHFLVNRYWWRRSKVEPDGLEFESAM